jgi:sulfatase maturation enzyme AslB (radical SAM superfamily)
MWSIEAYTMKKVIAIKQQHNVLQLTWVINNICTNACSYCPSGLHEGKNHHYDWDNARRFVDKLFEKYPLINLSIAGGEPTVSPHLPTNGARSVRYYEELSQHVNSMSFSWHPSFEDVNFLEKAVAASKRSLVNVRIMMDTRYWDHAVEFYHIAKKNNAVSVEPVRLQDWGVGHTIGREYTQEQLDWFNYNHRKPIKQSWFNTKKGLLIGSDYYYNDGSVDRSGQDPITIINRQENDFRGWMCNIGLESLFVHWDGDVQRANCRQGNPRIIGNINNPELIQWPTAPEVCVQHECHCATDVAITKWDPTSYNP